MPRPDGQHRQPGTGSQRRIGCHRRIVENAHQTAKSLLSDNHDQLERISKLLLVRETIEADEFVALLEGKPDHEVFHDDEEPTPPAEPTPEPETATREAARPLPRPRPGFAGGDAS